MLVAFVGPDHHTAGQLSRVDHTSHQQAAEVLGGTGPVLTTGDR